MLHQHSSYHTQYTEQKERLGTPHPRLVFCSNLSFMELPCCLHMVPLLLRGLFLGTKKSLASEKLEHCETKGPTISSRAIQRAPWHSIPALEASLYLFRCHVGRRPKQSLPRRQLSSTACMPILRHDKMAMGMSAHIWEKASGGVTAQGIITNQRRTMAP